MLAHIERLRAGGFVVTQDTIAALAEEYRVTAPQMFVVVEAEPVEGEEAAPVEAATVVAAPTPEEVAKAGRRSSRLSRRHARTASLSTRVGGRAAKRYGVVVPKLPPSAEKAPTITLAPTDVVEWISPNEVRAASGLLPRLLADGTRDPGATFRSASSASATRRRRRRPRWRRRWHRPSRPSPPHRTLPRQTWPRKRT